MVSPLMAKQQSSEPARRTGVPACVKRKASAAALSLITAPSKSVAKAATSPPLGNDGVGPATARPERATAWATESCTEARKASAAMTDKRERGRKQLGENGSQRRRALSRRGNRERARPMARHAPAPRRMGDGKAGRACEG